MRSENVEKTDLNQNQYDLNRDFKINGLCSLHFDLEYKKYIYIYKKQVTATCI
jgi:hypothetical protein